MRIWIRVDGSSSIGLGHVKRCLAIAVEAANRDLVVTFVVSQEGNEMTLPLLQDAGFSVMQVPPGTHEWLTGLGAGDVVLCDGYHLTDQIEAATMTPGIRVAAFDDLGKELPPVDVLLMPSLTDERISRPSRSKVLVGPRFVPVGRQFLSFRRSRGDAVSPLVVTLGSSDPEGLAPSVLSAIASLKEELDVVLLLGPGMRDVTLPQEDRFRSTRESGDIASFFDRFDAAVAAAGTTTWELLCMGMPTVLVVAAENQRGVVETALSNGAAIYGGDSSTIESDLPRALIELGSATRRRDLSTAALGLVDGKGAQRIVEALMT